METEVLQPVQYGTVTIDAGYRLDMLAESLVIIENKAVEQLLPIHQAQLLTYLKLHDCKLGFLINWNVPLIKDGIKRFALGYTPQISSTTSLKSSSSLSGEKR